MTMSNNVGQFGDTTLTKVFVGGLAWETPKESMKDHFDKYGEILEAVIISDKVTGRSKGYGFVTFKDPEAAKKACEDATPVINGRRANCNLASLGARRPRASSTPPPQHGQGASNVGPRSTTAAQASHVQWYYPAGTAATPFHHHQHHHHPVPYYGYTPAYVTADVSYNHKLSYSGGSYINGVGGQYYTGGQAMVGGNTLMPMYAHHHHQPFYHQYHHHHHQAMGLPAHHHIYSPLPTPATAPITKLPLLLSKPTSIVPTPGFRQ